MNKLINGINQLDLLRDVYLNQNISNKINNSRRRRGVINGSTNIGLNKVRRRLKYNFSSRFQKLGISGVKSNITNTLYFKSGDVGAFKIEDILASNGEFSTQRGNFEVYRVENIAVTIYPSLVLSNEDLSVAGRGLYLLMKYADSTAVSTETIVQDENVKIMEINRTTPKTYFFKLANYQSGNNFNFRAFHDTDNLAYAVNFFIYSGNGNIIWTLRLDLEVIFKQPKINIPTKSIIISNYGVFRVKESEVNKVIKILKIKEKKDEEKFMESINKENLDKEIQSLTVPQLSD